MGALCPPEKESCSCLLGLLRFPRFHRIILGSEKVVPEKLGGKPSVRQSVNYELLVFVIPDEGILETTNRTPRSMTQ